jgi:Na+/H+ antiporter NhaA
MKLRKMKLSNETYDNLKKCVMYILPALVTFAGVVMNTLEFQYTDKVLTIASAFITFLGTCLGISNYNYNKGDE